MNHLSSYINEAITKYVISYEDPKTRHQEKMFADMWQAAIGKLQMKGVEVWTVYDNKYSNFSEPEAVVAWHGKDSYWARSIESGDFRGEKAAMLKRKEIK